MGRTRDRYNPLLAAELSSRALVRVTREKTGGHWPPELAEVWVSREFLCQVYRPTDGADGAQRVSINRVTRNGKRWRDGITWDEVQRIKREIGRGEQWAVEVFPADEHEVDVANLRHIWLIASPPAFAWVNPETPEPPATDAGGTDG